MTLGQALNNLEGGVTDWQTKTVVLGLNQIWASMIQTCAAGHLSGM